VVGSSGGGLPRALWALLLRALFIFVPAPARARATRPQRDQPQLVATACGQMEPARNCNPGRSEHTAEYCLIEERTRLAKESSRNRRPAINPPQVIFVTASANLGALTFRLSHECGASGDSQ